MKLLGKRMRQMWRYGLAWPNYLLLGRAIQAAWLARRYLAERRISPHLAATITAAEKLYLPPQRSWRGVNEEAIIRFAGFVVGVPLTWGRCVQKSLIAYRLLNGYGIPTRFCCGIHRQDQSMDGHAWVEKLGEPNQVLGESANPYLCYLPVYTSPMPAAPE